jgi:FkbM family methyltransferase
MREILIKIKKRAERDKNSRFYKLLRFLWFFVENILKPENQKYIRKMVAAQHIDIEAVDAFIYKEDGVVIDIGAEKGEVATHFYKGGFKVFAFEPELKNYVYLIIFNFFRFVSGRFRVYKAACSDYLGEGKLNISNQSYFHTLIKGDKASGKFQKVRVVPIGRFIEDKNIKRIAFLKIDTEGLEREVLNGLFNFTAIKPKIIMFEFSHGELLELMEIVQRNGYNNFQFICRWNEKAGLKSQQRMGIYDGLHKDIFEADWGNTLCYNSSLPRTTYDLKE